MDFETASELLADDRGRAVVAILRQDSPISRRRLADRFVRRTVETREENATPDPATRYRMHAALFYDYLPRLAVAELVEYDSETVAATPQLERFAEWVGPLDRSGETTDRDELRNKLLAFYA